MPTFTFVFFFLRTFFTILINFIFYNFRCLTVVNGQLEVAYDLGGAPFSLRHPARIDDGLLHTVLLKRSAQETYLTVDNSTTHGTAPGLASSLNANGNIYLGAIVNQNLHTFFVQLIQFNFYLLILEKESMEFRVWYKLLFLFF